MRLLLLVGLYASWSNAADVIVSKEQFVEAMKTALPNAFCAEHQYFRKCFKVSEDDCIKEAMRATKTCLISMNEDLPPKLKQPDDGRKWGAKVGTCAGTGYETSLIKKKVDSADCKDTSKWK